MVKLSVLFFIRFVVNRDSFRDIINADASNRALKHYDLRKRLLAMSQKPFLQPIRLKAFESHS